MKIIEKLDIRKGHRYYRVQCECGNIEVTKRHKRPLCKVCANKEAGNKRRTHDASRHPLYPIYYSMKARCYNTEHPSYKAYGAKGVTVCDEWKNSYEAFYKWCIENGWKKGLHLDKDIKSDAVKIYSPETCSFVSRDINNAETRRSSAEQESDMVCMYNDGLKISEIREKYDSYSWNGIKGILVRHGVYKSSGSLKKEFSNEEIQSILGKYLTGVSCAAIAKEFNVTHKVIKKVLEEYNQYNPRN